MNLSDRPPLFEELAYSDTKLGEISLRRRTEPRAANQLVYEIKLDDEFLMSSLFTTGECALATMALERVCGGALEIVVGGLGLGYTAATVLDDLRVQSLIVVDVLGPVIEWHRQGLVPLGERLANDARCRLICGDFFALATDREVGFDHAYPKRKFDAILLDIDHSTSSWLSGEHRAFYSPIGLIALREKLRRGGQFAMWSNDPPDAAFLECLRAVFQDVSVHVVEFSNPYQEAKASCTIYVAAAAQN